MFLLRYITAIILLPVHLIIFMTQDRAGFMNQYFIMSDSFIFFKIILFSALLLTIMPFIFGVYLRRSKLDIKAIFTNVPFIMFFGLLGFVIVWGFKSLFYFNIIQLFCISLILFLPLFLINNKYRKIILASVFVLLFMLFSLFKFNNSYFSDWVNYYIFGLNSKDILWPILPWSILILFGYIIEDSKNYILNNYKYFYFILISIALILILGPIDMTYTNNMYFEILNQVEYKMFVFIMSLSIILYILSEKVFDKLTFIRHGVVDIFSRGILFVYMLQFVVGGLLGLVANIYIKNYYNKPFNFLLIFTCILILEFYIIKKITKSIVILMDKKILIKIKKYEK